jgi:hypothetical protein
MAPVAQFEYLVYQQHLSAILIKLASKLHKAVTLEEEVVHVYIQASSVLRTKILFGKLKQESSLSHPSAALDTYQAVTPVNFIHQ